ncbi:hypothetical protein GCM10010211_83390 [Streptomyces albospinus]|uniref:Uncharacterized protein n=1 Tax=Streptomyces albospinus TaxID=285515 RepID=A0ABQ2VPU8_9ACTN|nr:hypothetical protein GCM10010211_83390 [Streptomyces albospinus]
MPSLRPTHWHQTSTSQGVGADPGEDYRGELLAGGGGETSGGVSAVESVDAGLASRVQDVLKRATGAVALKAPCIQVSIKADAWLRCGGPWSGSLPGSRCPVRRPRW